jgi:hypothetical protein
MVARGTSRPRAVVCAALAIVLATSCQSPAPSLTPDALAPPSDAADASGSPTAGASIEPDRWDRTDTPVDVTITSDPAHSTTRSLGPEGGGLELVLPGGTVATLTIPPASLLEPTEISMTAAAIEGWAFAPRDRTAVQLQPDGLELFVPATLTFDQAAIGPDGSHGEIAWSGEGRSLRPVLAGRQGNVVSLQIEHFSGYGLVWNIESESYWTSWRKTAQLDAQADMEANLAAMLGIHQQKEKLGIDEEPLIQEIASFVDDWYDVVFEPLMRDGETNCEGGRAALSALLSMKRQLETIGFSVAEVYGNFLVRRKAGQSTRYAFDRIPDDYLEALVTRCDEEALSACRRTGDIELLMIYVKDRTRILILWGKVPEETQEGGELIESCARYRVDATFEFGVDLQFYDDAGAFPDTPKQQIRSHWSVELTVKLQWKHLDGVEPWRGRIEGEAAPVVRNLEARQRFRKLVGTDNGTRDEGWERWCNSRYTFGPWPPWRLELKGLEFNRERRIRTIKVGLFHPRKITIEGPLETYSFKSAGLLFDTFEGTRETIKDSCGGGGRDETAVDVLGYFLQAQPPDTGWRFTSEGFLSPYVVALRDPTSLPLTARREWQTARVIKRDAVGNIDGSVKWNATILLTHTPAG